MYTSTQNGSFQDGLFSQLNTRGAPRSYQSSVSQFNEGSLGLGATIRTTGRSMHRRGMRGFGHSFRDGSLGADAIDTSQIPNITIGPGGASITPQPTTPAPVPYYKQPAVLACAAIAVTAAFFLYKKK